MSNFPGSPVIYNDLLCFRGIQDQVVIRTPLDQILNLFIIVCLVVSRYQTHYSGVLGKLHHIIRGVYRCTVMCKEGEKGWTEDATLRYSCIQGKSRRNIITHPDILWSVCEKVQNPWTEFGGECMPFRIYSSLILKYSFLQISYVFLSLGLETI